MSLEALLESTLSGMGYELVQLVQGRGRLMQVFIDKPGGVSIDDCVAVSNQLTRLFTVENIDFDRLEFSYLRSIRALADFLDTMPARQPPGPP